VVWNSCSSEAKRPEHHAGQRMDAQRARGRAARIAHLVDDVVGAAHQLGAVAQEGLAHVAEPHHPRAAVEQRRAQELLQLLDARGDHRIGHPQLARRLRKALGLRDANEGFDALEAVHGGTVLRGPAFRVRQRGGRQPHTGKLGAGPLRARRKTVIAVSEGYPPHLQCLPPTRSLSTPYEVLSAMPKSPQPRARFSFSPTVRALLLAVAACGVALPALAAIEHEDVDRLMQAGKLDEAMAKADAFLKDKPRDPQMRFLKGVIQLDTGKRAEAIAAFTQLTLDAPELPEPYNNLAVIYASQNQFDKARSALESAIRTNPSYATAQENLGDVYARLASQAYSKALQLDQNNTAVQPKLAVIRTLFTPTPAGHEIHGAGRRCCAGAARTCSEAAGTCPTPAPAAAPAAKVAAAPAPVAAPAKAPEAAPAPAPAPAAASASVAEDRIRRPRLGLGLGRPGHGALPGRLRPRLHPRRRTEPQGWEEDRRARIVGKSSISVNIENLVIKVDGQNATARFRQIYRADSLNISSRKTLDMQRCGQPMAHSQGKRRRLVTDIVRRGRLQNPPFPRRGNLLAALVTASALMLAAPGAAFASNKAGQRKNRQQRQGGKNANMGADKAAGNRRAAHAAGGRSSVKEARSQQRRQVGSGQGQEGHRWRRAGPLPPLQARTAAGPRPQPPSRKPAAPKPG
jgi:tetratricopeptide (TPR) repeat protein